MKATFFTVSALIATAFAAPATTITARAEYDIRVSITDEYSGAYAFADVPSDGYKYYIKDFTNAAKISTNGYPAASSAMLNTIIEKANVQCEITSGKSSGKTFEKLTKQKTYVDFDSTTSKPTNLSGYYVSCVLV